jgi:CheY-like chemotaxis protein
VSGFPKVLIIEDDRMLRLTLAAYLEDCGYGVVEANHGVQGMAVFAQEHPDVVVCDLRMPELDGFGVLAQLRQQSPATPVVIVTGTGDTGAKTEALAAGARACFLKPINDLGELTAVIQQAWEQARDIKDTP